MIFYLHSVKNETYNAIEAVLFDMDGLLIDSEPFWRRSMILEFEKIGLTLTEEMCAQTMGLRIDEVVAIWYERHPWSGSTVDEVSQKIIDGVCALIQSDGKAMEGVEQIISLFHQLEIPVGLASSSSMKLIETVIEHLNLKPHLQLWHSAEYEQYGKPHPQVFITAAQKMGFAPEKCLVFEDSLNGVISGKAAKMKVVAVPEKPNQANPAFAVADLQLRSLLEFDVSKLESL